MNVLILFCLIFFTFVRAVGFAVVFDFFYDTRDNKFKLFIIAWSFWIIASLLAIYINIVKEVYLIGFLFLFNILAAILGFIFFAWGMFEYYISVPRKFMELFIVLIIVMSLFLYIIINILVAMIFCIIILNGILLSTYIIPPLKKKEFKEFMGKSIRWYYAIIITFFIYFPVSFLINISGYGYGLYTADDPTIIMLYYIPSIGATILLIVLHVHLEYTTSASQKSDLKDKYSHDLGNIMQVVISASDLTEIDYNQEKDIKSNLKLIKEKTEEASKIIKQIRRL